MAKTNPSPRTRLNVRDVRADQVWEAMRAHADEIRDVRDVQRLDSLADMTGECVAVAVADLVNLDRVVGHCGSGRIRAVEPGA